MRIITSHHGLLQTLSEGSQTLPAKRTFATGLPALDGLLPGGAFARGAVHEALSDPRHGPPPRSFALLLARSALLGNAPKPMDAGSEVRPRAGSAAGEPGSSAYLRTGVHGIRTIMNPLIEDPEDDGGIVVWSDPAGDLYPPAIAAGGVPLDRLLLLRPPTPRDEVWAVAECLRCPAVAAVVAAIPKLTRVEARRLQLAAERGGGVGVLLRPCGTADIYAAATRWLVAPAPGDEQAQRWQIQLIHGHGGRVGQSVLLEVDRESSALRAVEPMADRTVAAVPRRATA